MASVNSPVRKLLKPLLYKLFSKNLYLWFQTKAKIRDIELRLVEEKEMELLPHFMNGQTETIDIGANYAYYTILLAKKCKKVYAFEPIPFTYKVCKRIVKHYKQKNVELFHLGVGARDENVVFNVPQLDFGAISAGQAHMDDRNNELQGKEQHYKFNKSEKINCKVIKLDNFYDELSNVSFIKIDIEGAEYFALKGMEKILAKHKPVILIEINPFFLKGFSISENELREYLSTTLKYTTFVYEEKTKKLIPYANAYIESNYILIHNDQIHLFTGIIQK